MSGAARSGPALRRLAAAVLLAGTAGLAGGAEEEPSAAPAGPGLRLPPVVVSAYRIPVLLESLSYSVELITRDELEARQPLTVADAVRALPGLHVDQLGGPGGTTNVYVRGGEANHTLVLIDGVRVNDPNDVRGGSYDLSAIATADIERIEVLRGAHSAVFGADAMGGVINIVTARGRRKPQASARAGAGGQGLRELSASASGGAVAVDASRLLDGTVRDGSRSAATSAFASLHWAPAQQWTTRLALRSLSRRSEAFPEASGGPRLAEIRQLEHREVDEELLSLDNDVLPERGPRWNLRLSRLEREEATASPGVAPGAGGFVPASDSRSRLTREVAAVTARFERLPHRSAATLGGELVRERGVYDTAIPVLGVEAGGYSLRRRTRSVFGELRLRPSQRLLLVLSARRDAVSGLAAVTSRSVGLRHALQDGRTVLRANWSEGFKPPSFSALGHPLVGNPALVPETSRTAELGVDVQAGAAALVRATAFATRYAQLIDFDAERFRNVNRGRVSADGLELSARLAATPRVTVEAGHTWVHLRSDSGTPLRNRPAHRSSVRTSFRVDQALRLEAGLIEVGRTRDFSVPTGDAVLPGYRRVDLALRWRPSRHWAFEAAVDNLLDRHHESFLGFPHPGARLRIAVRGSL